MTRKILTRQTLDTIDEWCSEKPGSQITVKIRNDPGPVRWIRVEGWRLYRDLTNGRVMKMERKA